MKKIVLVDDQPIANFITKKLLELEGMNENVKDFTNPVKAYEFIEKKEELILFLDLNMPEMSGWDFLDKMKEKGLNFQTIILTSSSSDLDREKAGNYTFVMDYVVKPLTREKFSQLFFIANTSDSITQ